MAKPYAVVRGAGQEALRVLREMEWRGAWDLCPRCAGIEPEHTEKCSLAGAIRTLEEAL